MYIRQEAKGDVWIRYHFPYNLRRSALRTPFWRPVDSDSIKTDIGFEEDQVEIVEIIKDIRSSRQDLEL